LWSSGNELSVNLNMFESYLADWVLCYSISVKQTFLFEQLLLELAIVGFVMTKSVCKVGLTFLWDGRQSEWNAGRWRLCLQQ